MNKKIILLYGLGDFRTKYKDTLEKQSDKPKPCINYIDHYNNEIAKILRKKSK